ncbi:MAG: trypsin-like peptidase domain-containing protein [Gemmatimonadaceae bacterium]|nr:trypsin-like peptidase domain-containing protein [Gemmatimonadaceae bacterium]
MAFRLTLLSGAVLVLACEGVPAASSEAQRPAVSTPAVANAPSRAEQASASLPLSRRTAITEAVSKVAPAVVTVQTETVQDVPVDPFEMFFGGARSGQRRQSGIGSGFIVQADGVIVTNAHVVNGATKIVVALRDGQTYDAKLVGMDEMNDLAVLRINANRLPVAPIGSSGDLAIGEWAIAIGNPYGFLLGNTEPSVTAGVISATGRNLVPQQGQSETGGTYVDMLQTDASINPGNSGGPLVNALGQVIGVNTSIFSPSGGSIGLGFAIPINRAMRVADDLLKHGAVRHPWIGLRIAQPAGNTPREVLRSGVVVRSVVLGSPAAQAGIKPGDQIVRSRGRFLRNMFDWEGEMLELRVGEAAAMVISRDGREETVSVTPADMPEVGAKKVEVLRDVQLVTLTPAIRQERNIRSTRGALVVNASDRVMDQLGVMPGDVIIGVNRVSVSSAEEVARAIDQLAGRGMIQLIIERRGAMYSTQFYIQ